MWFAAVFERLRTILHEALIDKRVQYMIEVMFAVRKDGFKVMKNSVIFKLQVFVCLCFWRILCELYVLLMHLCECVLY